MTGSTTRPPSGTRGTVAGVYRKRHPAIRRTVYSAGTDTPVFRVDGLTFGIAICYDSNFSESASRMAAARERPCSSFQRTTACHVRRAGEDLVARGREADVARATENKIWIAQADVAGRTSELASAGSSEIVRPDGAVVAGRAGVRRRTSLSRISDSQSPEGSGFQER